jgi:hypothetical protein
MQDAGTSSQVILKRQAITNVQSQACEARTQRPSAEPINAAPPSGRDDKINGHTEHRIGRQTKDHIDHHVEGQSRFAATPR